MQNKKVKFTWIDALIIIVVVVCLFIGGTVFGLIKTNNKITGDTVNVAVTVELTNMEDRVHDELLKSKGEEFLISDKSTEKLILKEVEAKRAQILAFNELKGEYSLADRTKNWDITVVLTGKAVETDSNIEIGGVPVKVGSKLSLKNSFVGPSGYATAVEIIK